MDEGERGFEPTPKLISGNSHDHPVNHDGTELVVLTVQRSSSSRFLCLSRSGSSGIGYSAVAVGHPATLPSAAIPNNRDNAVKMVGRAANDGLLDTIVTSH
jgi:hypothetical protein